MGLLFSIPSHEWGGGEATNQKGVQDKEELEKQLLIAQIGYYGAQTKLAVTLEEAQNAKTLLLGIEADLKGAELDMQRLERNTIVSEIKDDQGNVIRATTLAELLLKEKEARASKTIRQELRDVQREKEGSPRPSKPPSRYNNNRRVSTPKAFNPVIKGRQSLEELKAEVNSKPDP
jgi:hypothetical protein